MRAQFRHKGHDQPALQLHSVAGKQIMSTDHRGVLQRLALSAGQHLQQTLGNIPDIGAAGLHHLILHSGEHLGKLLTSAGHGVLRRIELTGNIILYRLQIVQILHHHFVDVKNLGGGLASLLHGFVVKKIQLSTGLFNSIVKAAALTLDSQARLLLIGGQLRLLIQPDGADGHAR